MCIGSRSGKRIRFENTRIIIARAPTSFMAHHRIPAYLITGATGAGKTTLVTRLLEQRPQAERWAVLVNDFGRSLLAAADRVIDENVTVRQVAGCMCCTGQVSMRTALVSLLRTARPHRLLIEVSAAAEPASVMRVLAEPALSKAVELRSTLCAVHSAQLADQRYRTNDVYREQIAEADVIVLEASGLTEDARVSALGWLKAIGSIPPQVLNASDVGTLLDLL